MAVRTYQGITPTIGERVFIDPASVVLGDVVIGDDSSVWPCAVIRGDVHKIRIGDRTNVQDGSILHVTHAGEFNDEGYPLILGDDITVGHSVNLHGCTIHDRVLIGIGSTVMDNVVVESEVMIGAGSLVPPGKVLESGHLYVGNPVKKVRELSDKEKGFFGYSSDHYVKVKNSHLAENY